MQQYITNTNKQAHYLQMDHVFTMAAIKNNILPALKIVIAGAGLGGLSCAIACALSGHSVTVVESTKKLVEVRWLVTNLLLLSETDGFGRYRLAQDFKLRRMRLDCYRHGVYLTLCGKPQRSQRMLQYTDIQTARFLPWKMISTRKCE